jgi:putative CocE/NonD family hydrolase
MTVGGWFDAEDLFGTLQTYGSTERQNPGIINLLVMGPWSHGEWGRGPGEKLGPITFHARTAEFYREKIELPFFRHFLKADTNYSVVKAHMFETGTDQWRSFDAWPPSSATERTLYFRSGAGLAFEPPTDAAEAYDQYPSDPAKPVPYTMVLSTDYPRSFPVEDQRFAGCRPDVLLYQTEPLQTDLTLAGPLKASLHVATSGTDADWVVKLVDVYPGDFPDPDPNPAKVRLGGNQQLVRAEVFRGKFRNSFEHPEPFQPGKLAKIEFALQDVCHCFRRGHRVMVQVQSSWFPLVDRNPQTFTDIPTAKLEDFRKAMHRIYRSAQAPSSLIIHVWSPPKP